MNTYTVRPEQKHEFPLIYALIKEAFATAKVSNGDEQDFADRLRVGKGYIPELALVVEEGGRLIGHIMLTQLTLYMDKGESMPILLLAPLSVRLESRCRGLGAALINESFKRARTLGHAAVFLAGDPAYYGRFSFLAAGTFDICHEPASIPGQYVLACELYHSALTNKSGIFNFFE